MMSHVTIDRHLKDSILSALLSALDSLSASAPSYLQLTLQQIDQINSQTLDQYYIQEFPNDRQRSMYIYAWEGAWSSIQYIIKKKYSSKKSELIRQFFLIFELALRWSETGKGGDTFAASIIEESFELNTTGACCQLFDFLGTRYDRLIANMEPKKGKGLIFLRICTDLLSRINPVNEPDFVSKVLLFLSKAYPAGEQSGVNLKAYTNEANVTMIESIPEEVIQKAGPDEKSRIEFYSILWRLQQLFNNPKVVLEEKERTNFSMFKSSVFRTLREFAAISERLNESFRSTTKTTSKQDSKTQTNSKAHPNHTKMEFFSSKFLTSWELFEAELTDTYFRRQILTQFLIIFEFLLFYTERKVKRYNEQLGQPKDASQPKKNPYMLSKDWSYLNEDETRWVKSARAATIIVLSRIPPDGIKFAETVVTLLKEEMIWVKWKMGYCRPPLAKSAKSQIESRILERRQLLDAPLHPKYPDFGNLDYDELWSVGIDEENFFKDSERMGIPTFEEWAANLDDEFKGEFDKEFMKTENSVWLWQAFRILGREHFSSLALPKNTKLNWIEIIRNRVFGIETETPGTQGTNTPEEMEVDSNSIKESTPPQADLGLEGLPQTQVEHSDQDGHGDPADGDIEMTDAKVESGVENGENADFGVDANVEEDKGARHEMGDVHDKSERGSERAAREDVDSKASEKLSGTSSQPSEDSTSTVYTSTEKEKDKASKGKDRSRRPSVTSEAATSHTPKTPPMEPAPPPIEISSQSRHQQLPPAAAPSSSQSSLNSSNQSQTHTQYHTRYSHRDRDRADNRAGTQSLSHHVRPPPPSNIPLRPPQRPPYDQRGRYEGFRGNPPQTYGPPPPPGSYPPRPPGEYRQPPQRRSHGGGDSSGKRR